MERVRGGGGEEEGGRNGKERGERVGVQRGRMGRMMMRVESGIEMQCRYSPTQD